MGLPAAWSYNTITKESSDPALTMSFIKKDNAKCNIKIRDNV